MPITLGNVTLEYKSLPLVLREDGSAEAAVRKGYMKDGAFVEISRQTFGFNADDVSLILDAPPIPGLTRRDDLAIALYQELVARGLVEAGEIK
jgi:hypothetical protein